MADIAIKVVECPLIRTAGMKIRTTMANALKDCPELWEKRFGPRMAEFPSHPARQGESYGASVVIEEDVFDYWAVMPLADGAAAPEGMKELSLPAGLYAVCDVPSLDELMGCYGAIYQKWLPGNAKYAMDLSRPCYELYGPEYLSTGKFLLYCPVAVK